MAYKHSFVADLQRHRWKIGLILLAVVVVLWVASGFLVNAMSVEYSKPYFITYINTATFVLYLGPTVRKALSQLNRPTGEALLTPEGRRRPSAASLDPEALNDPGSAFTVRETAILSSQFAVLWFLSNLLNNASYVYTSVASATIISCTSSFFTLLVGSLFGIERFTMVKLCALVISIAGLWLISVADNDNTGSGVVPPNAMFGNFLALGSAMLYGVYTTLLKVKIGDESRINTRMFFGFVGLFNIVFLWPMLLVLHFTGMERFSLPQSSYVWMLLISNGAAILISDFCWVLAMLMTSPLVVTVGLSATIPLSMIGDMFINGLFPSALYYVGAGLVFWSFFVINRQEEEAAVTEVIQHDETEELDTE